MNLIHNSRFTIPALRKDYSSAMWRISNGNLINAISSENTKLVWGEILSMNCENSVCKLLGWNGTQNKPPLNGWVELDINSPIPQISNIALQITPVGVPDKAFLGTGNYELVSYEDEIRNCAYYGQELSVDYHANQCIGQGLTGINPNDLKVFQFNLSLPYPIRGADGSAGANDIKVNWGGAMNSRWYVYAGGTSMKVISMDLSCVHRNFIGFNGRTATALPAKHDCTLRSYYLTQADINAARLTESITIDANIRE